MTEMYWYSAVQNDRVRQYLVEMNIKQVLWVMVLGAMAFMSPLSAQEQSSTTTKEAETLFGGANAMSTKDVGFFIAPAFALTPLDGSMASMAQVRGGVSLKDALSVGAYYGVTINQVVPQSETIPGIYMDYWSVGGFAEYTLLSKKLIHATFPVYVGYGEVEMDNESGDAGLGEANFIQFEPSALLEVNVSKYIRLNLGAGYRFVGPMTYRNFNQTDISGVTAQAGLKVGLFK